MRISPVLVRPVAMAGAVSATIVELLPVPVDDNITVHLWCWDYDTHFTATTISPGKPNNFTFSFLLLGTGSMPGSVNPFSSFMLIVPTTTDRTGVAARALLEYPPSFAFNQFAPFVKGFLVGFQRPCLASK